MPRHWRSPPTRAIGFGSGRWPFAEVLASALGAALVMALCLYAIFQIAGA